MNDHEHKHHSTHERAQKQLKHVWQWSEKILAERHDPDEPSEASVPTGTWSENDQGYFTTIRIEEKGSEMVFDLERTRHGMNIADQDRGQIERYILAETQSGGYFLRASGIKPSLADAEMMNRHMGEEDYQQALEMDESTLEASLHEATRDEVDRLNDLVEIAALGEAYKLTDMDAINYLVGSWRDDLGMNDNAQPDDIPHKRLSKFEIVRAALLRLFKK